MCAPKRRASRRVRQRALELTDIDIESSQGRTTGEAIVRVGGFAIHVGIDICECVGFGPLKGVDTALNCEQACRVERRFADSAQRSPQLPNSSGG
jgi:hypothetical protein